MLPAIGRNDIGAAFIWAIAKRNRKNKCPVDFTPDSLASFSKSSLSELYSSYDEACSFLERNSPSDHEINISHLFRSMRINADLSGLYRRNIDGSINELCTLGGNVAQFIDDTISRWANVLRFHSDGNIFLGGWLTRENFCLSESNEISLNGVICNARNVLLEASKSSEFGRYSWLKAIIH